MSVPGCIAGSSAMPSHGSAALQAAAALVRIVRYLALSATGHWPARALQWLSDGYPVDDLWPEVEAASEKRTLSQHARHQARWLLKTRRMQ